MLSTVMDLGAVEVNSMFFPYLLKVLVQWGKTYTSKAEITVE